MGLGNSKQTRPQDSPSSSNVDKDAAAAEGKGHKFGLLRRLKRNPAAAEKNQNSLAASIGLPALPEQDHGAAEDQSQAYGICQPLGSYFNAHVDSFRIARQAGGATDCKPEGAVEGHPNSKLGPKLNAKTVSWGESSAIGVPRSPFAGQEVGRKSMETTPVVSERQDGKEPENSIMDAPLEIEKFTGAVSSSTPSNLSTAGETGFPYLLHFFYPV